MIQSKIQNPRSSIRRYFLFALAFLARPFARRSGDAPPRRILVIKPDHLGDLLLATPALAALRETFPCVHITALVGPWGRDALATNPDIDALQTLPFPGFERQEPAPSSVRRLLQPYITLLRYA